PAPGYFAQPQALVSGPKGRTEHPNSSEATGGSGVVDRSHRAPEALRGREEVRRPAVAGTGRAPADQLACFLAGNSGTAYSGAAALRLSVKGSTGPGEPVFGRGHGRRQQRHFPVRNAPVR